MALESFSFEKLLTMDGGAVAEAFDQCLGRIRFDLSDRPGVDKARKILLEVEMAPVSGQRGDLESVNVTFAVKDTVPKRATKTYSMLVEEDELQFNELSRDNAAQGTLDSVPQAEGDKPTAAPRIVREG